MRPLTDKYGCLECKPHHDFGRKCTSCATNPSREIHDHPRKAPILVPLEMTDERIAAAVAASRDTRSWPQALQDLKIIARRNPDLDARAVCAQAGLRMEYDQGHPEVLDALTALGRDIRRKDSHEVA